MLNYLFILRGPPASGKSTTAASYFPETSIVSSDKLREQIGLTIDKYGNSVPTEKSNTVVWEITHKIIEEKMKNLGTIVYDTCAPNNNSIKRLKKLAEEYNYYTVIVDFGEDLSFEQLKERNSKRDRIVPDAALFQFYNSLLNRNKKGFDYSIKGEELFEFCSTNEVADIIFGQHVDTTNYNRIHVLGDIQGCYVPLREFLDDVLPLPKNELIFFVGDLLDRGPDNDMVLLQCMKLKESYPDQVFFTIGNHELHLFNWANNNTPKSPEFLNGTEPQLESNSSIDKKDVKEFLKCFRSAFTLRNLGHNDLVIITHAGIKNFNNLSIEYPNILNVKGVGTYATDVDDMFNQDSRSRTDRNYYQIHGHRNKCDHDNNQPDNRSFNLQCNVGVEFNGEFRTLTISNVDSKYLFNTNYYSYVQLDDDNQEIIIDKTPNLIRSYLADSRYQVKHFEDYGIYAINTNRKVFYDNLWDNETVKARSLFRYEDGTIAARGWDKFFNINENEENQLHNLKKNLNFPLSKRLKPNGFLGLLSFNKNTNDYLVCTKSSVSNSLWVNEEKDAEYVIYFKRLLQKWLFSDIDVEYSELLEIIKKNNITVLFEVIDLHQREKHNYCTTARGLEFCWDRRNSGRE